MHVFEQADNFLKHNEQHVSDKDSQVNPLIMAETENHWVNCVYPAGVL
jgi:hypothetical protein